MSFIREVIGLVNQNECVDSHQTIRILVEEIKNFQYKIKTYIDDNYVNFLPNLENNRMILDEGQRLYLAIESLHENISNDKQRDLSRLDDELSHAMEELEEVALGLKTSNKILQIDDLFGAIEIAKNSGECLKVMAYTSEMHYLIYDKEDEVLPHLDCFENIKIKYQIEHETMMFNLKRQFNSLVQLTEKKFQKTKSVSIKITKDDNKLHETIVALINSNFNSNQIANFLMENVFEPIVTKPISIQFFEENCGFAELILSYSLQPMGNDLRPNYRVVFDHIKTAFMCLGYMNISISPDVCMFGIIANLIKDKFLRLLRDNCLLESIPNTMDEMHESTLVDDLLEFDEFLCRMLFLNEKTDTELRDFAGRVEMLFKNRFCSNILESAVAIMRHDLHDMVLMADLVNPIKEEEGSTACLGAAAFPRCMISKSTLELVNLMDKVLRRSESAQDELTNRLLSTIPTIIDRYITEVPSSHAKLLLNIPQQTALFHNNCMYLAYWLTMNAAKCNEPTATLVKSLHTCGNEHFLRQSTNQREQLMDILKEFDISKTTSELDPQTNKVIRQCLRQLDLLKNVWQTILPEGVYNKTMAAILNDFCREIIRRILVIDDIPSSVASGLHEILDNIVTRAPFIFQDDLQISVLVKTWTKLCQLKMMLNAPMAHITEQWSEGKGPLSLHYKAEEVKHLIRALFQNTDRRANALDTIT